MVGVVHLRDLLGEHAAACDEAEPLEGRVCWVRSVAPASAANFRMSFRLSVTMLWPRTWWVSQRRVAPVGPGIRR